MRLIYMLLWCAPLAAQVTGELRGKVILERDGPVQDAQVQIIRLNRLAATDAQGAYHFANVPPGVYEVVAHQHPFTEQHMTVEVKAGAVATLDLTLRIAPVHSYVTVTASGREVPGPEAFQSVNTLESIELTSRAAPSLGEVLENQPGVAKRSSGPGTTRPVIRGFDGDRVLILQDGMPTGTLSYQSGDHGEPIDATSVERIEVVRGPATLLYGSNAIGGVVNTIGSEHQIHEHPTQGVQGHITGSGGSNNGAAGTSAAFNYGFGNWMLWGGGGAQRTGEYQSPLGVVQNSQTRMEQSSAGFGYFGHKYFGSLEYGVYDGKYGVPVPPDLGAGEERVQLEFRRHNVRLDGGLKNPTPALERVALHVNYTDWRHFEVADGSIDNRFYNKQFNYRGVFDQRKRGPWLGSFGLMGNYRDYKALGAEAFAPPVTEHATAAFGLQQFDFERFRVQIGGRIENTHYNPVGLDARSFTGFSGAAGFQAGLWQDGRFVANFTHSYRAPGLEELYADGPHAGNLTYEVGNLNMMRERSEGVEVALRHHSSRIRGDITFFQYWLSDYIFLAPTGAIRDNLIEAQYSQGDARYRGAESALDVAVHPNLWLNFGVDVVHAALTRPDTPLPRIPPLRGRFGIETHWKALTLKPGFIVANRQNRTFPTETPTAGYGLFNLDASYIVTRQHTMHIFGVDAFNLSDTLYRNHLSFIKDFAPEIGRGVRFHYTVEFF